VVTGRRRRLHRHPASRTRQPQLAPSQQSGRLRRPRSDLRNGRDAALTDAVGVALALGEKEHGTRCDREPSGRLKALPVLGIRQFMCELPGTEDSALPPTPWRKLAGIA